MLMYQRVVIFPMLSGKVDILFIDRINFFIFAMLKRAQGIFTICRLLRQRVSFVVSFYHEETFEAFIIWFMAYYSVQSDYFLVQDINGDGFFVKFLGSSEIFQVLIGFFSGDNYFFIKLNSDDFWSKFYLNYFSIFSRLDLRVINSFLSTFLLSRLINF